MTASVVATGLVAVLTVAAAPSPLDSLSGAVEVARESEPVVLTGASIPDWSTAAAVGQPAPFPAGTGEEVPGTDGVRSAHHGTLVVPPDPRSDTNAPVDAATVEEAQQLAEAGVITPGQGEELADYLGPMADPVPGIDDDDEIALMADDAGAQAPAEIPAPAGTDPATRKEVTLVDPVTGERSFVYLFLAEGGSSFTHETGYVDHRRDDTADLWASRATWTDHDPEKLGTSNTGYGANLPGTSCAVSGGADHDTTTPETFTVGDPVEADDRFPLDGVTVTTGTYEFRATGRWMVREMRVAAPDRATRAPGQRPAAHGPDLVDRWKGRAFQQSPDSEISVVGFEDEQVNWEANSTLIGWRAGPVRSIRAVWGADSGTNVTKTTTFTRDALQQRYRVRVHPIPPAGLYVLGPQPGHGRLLLHRGDGAAGPQRRDHLRGRGRHRRRQRRHRQPRRPAGPHRLRPRCPRGRRGPRLRRLPGRVRPGRPDPGPAGGVRPVGAGLGARRRGQPRLPARTLEGASSLTNPVVIPYYRDDACLDDGTGDDPVPRPWPGEDSSDPRVREGYEAANGGTPYDQLACTDRQGAFGSHGLHFLVTGDTDNAFVGSPVPVNEIDGSQWQFAAPTASPGPVGERYAQVVRAPLQSLVVPQPGDTVESEPDEPGDPGDDGHPGRYPPEDRGGQGPARCRQG